MEISDNTYDFSMNLEANRRATFTDWPFDGNCNCTADEMAAAGFYHCPTDRSPDITRCFLCFKELEGWEPTDSPWVEHKHHSPKCAFVKLNKKEADMTVEEFLNLETERQSNRMTKIVEQKMKEFQEMASHVREQMEHLV